MVSNRKRDAVANIATAGLLAVGAAVAFSAAAAADPPPPEPLPVGEDAAPPPPPPGPTIPVVGAPLGPAGFNVLAQNGQAPVPGALGAPPVNGLDRDSVLGQNPLPAAPGVDPGVVPNLNVFNNAYGPQQCLVPSAPGKCEQFDVAPGDENADVSRREWLGRYIDMYRAGMLKGDCWGRRRRNSSVNRCRVPRRRQGPGSRPGWISSSPTRRLHRAHHRCCLRRPAEAFSAN
jgi:hypothetical protein